MMQYFYFRFTDRFFRSKTIRDMKHYPVIGYQLIVIYLELCSLATEEKGILRVPKRGEMPYIDSIAKDIGESIDSVGIAFTYFLNNGLIEKIESPDEVHIRIPYVVNNTGILVGHTRVSLMKEIGASSVKAILVDCDDVKATLLINQSNIQRTKVSDIELTRAYKATYDALKNQGRRTDLTSSQSGMKLRTDEEVAEKYGISKNTLRRKMALADCSDGIIKQYNRGLITQEQVQNLSKLPADVQEQVSDVLKEGNIMTKDIAENLLDVYNEVMKDPPLRASFPLNTIRGTIQEGQPKKEEKGKKKSDSVGKVKSTKFNIADDLFLKEVKKVNRNKYIEVALKYILEHKISFDCLVILMILISVRKRRS